MKTGKLLMTLAFVSMTYPCAAQKVTNPFFTEFKTQFGVPPFDKIKVTDYEPAINKGIAEQNSLIQKIINNKQKPSFANTILALDESSPMLNRVTTVYYNMTDADTNDQLVALSERMDPLLTAHNDNIYLNQKLFAKVKAVHDGKEYAHLTTEQKRFVDNVSRNFVRS